MYVVVDIEIDFHQAPSLPTVSSEHLECWKEDKAAAIPF